MTNMLWAERYEELAEFYRLHGHVEVPRWDEKRRGLYNWIIAQRSRPKDKGKKLSQDKVDMLNRLGFAWDAGETKYDSAWNDQYERLKKYILRHGKLVPLKTGEDSALRKWIDVQRRMYGLKKLREDRVQKLEGIGFIWSLKQKSPSKTRNNSQYEKKWMKKYEELVAYEKEHGNALVPYRHKQLGNWVRGQRLAFKELRLSEHRRKLLDEVNFVYLTLDDQWENGFRRLADYKSKHGGSVEIPDRSGHKELADWVRTQKAAYRNGKLAKGREMRLRTLGVPFDTANVTP